MSIALSLGNNLTTGGIFKPTAVNNTSVNNVTDFASITGDATLVLLSTQTASASASISFTSGINSTYDEYIFKFINIHPSSDGQPLLFQGSTDGGSTYGVTITSTAFQASLDEANLYPTLQYSTGRDLAQSTSYQRLSVGGGIQTGNDNSISGYLHLFEPSSNTFVKHFISNTCFVSGGDYQINSYIAGYGNTTSAINAIDFKMTSGNIDAGTIQMFGIL